MTVRLHPHDESQLAGARSESKKVRMCQWLAARQCQIEHLEIGEVLEEIKVLLSGQRLAFQTRVVVAKRAVEITAVGQLDKYLKEDVLLPGLDGDSGQPYGRLIFGCRL